VTGSTRRWTPCSIGTGTRSPGSRPQLDALSPLRVLDRGYAVPTDPAGRVLRRLADFLPGTPFTLRVVDGRVAARAEPPAE
jgi:Exonuclease VII, large subunit